MTRNCLLLGILGLIISCSGLPRVFPAGDAAGTGRYQKCPDPFPGGNWQFLHAIEATLPGGRKGFVMGLTVIHTADRSVHSVMMTIEGLVLLDVRYNQRLVVKRAVAPFDARGFARGLIRDIQLIFFKPPGALIAAGFLAHGVPVCRYQNPDGSIVDVTAHPDRSWQIRRYDRRGRLQRTVRGVFTKQSGPADHAQIPDKIVLTAPGSLGYALSMKLVEAVALAR